MKQLIQELCERNREKGQIALISKKGNQTKPMYCFSTDDLDQITQDTAEAVLEHVREMVKEQGVKCPEADGFEGSETFPDCGKCIVCRLLANQEL